MGKPILVLDFDGVIHSYTSGWRGATECVDPPVPGAMRFIVDAVGHFDVAIYSSRSHQPGGIIAMQHYIATALEALLPPSVARATFAQLQWPTEKPAARVTIDDRALTFTGVWPSMAALLAFEPWNKRKRGAA